MPKDRAHHGHAVQARKGARFMSNPVICKEGKGERNFACRHYDSCLEKTAKSMWAGFTCRECAHYHQKEQEQLPT